jgi:hypothetical protein
VLLQIIQLSFAWQSLVPKQEGHFFKCRMSSEVVDVVTLVNEFPSFTVDV